MAYESSSPNMSLPIPAVGLTAGPQYGTDINNCLTIIDGHSHTSGSGVQITPPAININTDLPFNDNNATLLRSTRYQVQPAALSLVTDLGCVYVTGVDLYYNDLNGNQIKLTASGAVNATASGISSGAATASFSGGVLVVDSAALTPANIKGGSVLIGNNTASSNYITLAPTAALSSSYTLTLPTIPAGIGFLTLDTNGNISASNVPLSGGITAPNIAAGTITTSQISSTAGILGTQLAANTVAQSNLYIRAVALSASAGNVMLTGFTTSSITSLTPVAITNQGTLVTTGRPVMIMIVSDNNGQGNFQCGASSNATLSVYVDGSSLFETAVNGFNATTVTPIMQWLYVPGSTGSHTYQLYGNVNSTGTLSISNAKLLVYEL